MWRCSISGFRGVGVRSIESIAIFGSGDSVLLCFSIFLCFSSYSNPYWYGVVDGKL